ncbi:hypothetical protein ACSSS7_008341 [Eimeria intestinalis]
MEAYDPAFLEGVLEGSRETLDSDIAQRMQKPSHFLFPEIGEQQSLSLRLDKDASARLSHLTLFASTKGIVDDPEQQKELDKPPEQQVVRRLVQRETNNHVGNNNQNNPATLLPPSKLSQWRRISLATTKSSETEGELPPLSLDKSLRGSSEEQQVLQQQQRHIEIGLASPAANSRTSSISGSPSRPMEAGVPVVASLRSQVAAAAAILTAQQQQQQQQEAAAARSTSSQASRKRCESGLIECACGPSTFQSFASPQQQQTQLMTPGYAQTPSPVPSLVQQQQHQPQKQQHQQQQQQQMASQNDSPQAAARSSSSKEPVGDTQEVCASQALALPPGLMPLKMHAAPNPGGILAVSAAELFAAFPQHHTAGGLAAWRSTPQTTLQLLVFLIIQLGLEAAVYGQLGTGPRDAQSAGRKASQGGRGTTHVIGIIDLEVQKLHEKVGKRLLNLLKAQEEERRQLALAFAKAKSKILARIEMQARAAEAIPSLSLSSAKAANGDRVVEAASIEMQKIMEATKRGILEKLAAANVVYVGNFRGHAEASSAESASEVSMLPPEVVTATAQRSSNSSINLAAAERRDGAWRATTTAAKQQEQQQQEEEEEEDKDCWGSFFCVVYRWVGARALGRVLSASTPLEFLDLCCNRLGDYGAEELAAGLGSNTTLRVLLLNRNNICQRGLFKIADALSFN